MRRTLLALLLCLALPPAPVRAQYLGPPQEISPPPPPPAEPPEEVAPPPGALPPAQGAEPEWTVRRLRVWATLGATFAYGQGAVNLGGGVGYFVYGGLLPTLDLGVSFGSGPAVFLVKPGLDWFLPVRGAIVPFVGGYYAHWFVTDGYLSQDAWGARGGFSFASVGPATFLVGIAYERVFTNCTGTCAYWVPQIAAGFAL
ncbi:MAG: hypothetical protein WB493_14385 [Anaeromyxobacteraceae bacterium]